MRSRESIRFSRTSSRRAGVARLRRKRTGKFIPAQIVWNSPNGNAGKRSDAKSGAGQISADHLSPKGKHPIAQGREATLGIYEQIDATPTGLHRPAQPAILLVLSRTVTQADLVRDLKRTSTLWCKPRNSWLQDFAWQSGYGAFSVGQTEVAAVTKYIEQQEKHHAKRSFQEEYLAFLRKYRIPYDERYVWD